MSNAVRSHAGRCCHWLVAFLVLAVAAGCLPAESVPGVASPAEPGVEAGAEFAPAVETAEPRYSIVVGNTVMLVDGDVNSGYPNGAGPGTGIDYHRDLGVDTVFVDLDLQFEAQLTPADTLSFRFNYMRTGARDWTTRRDLEFDHEVFPAHELLDSTMILWRRGAAYRRLLYSPPEGSALPEVELGGGMELVNIRQRISAPELGLSDVEDYKAVDTFLSLDLKWTLADDLSLHVDFERSLPIELMEDRSHEHMRIFGYIEWQFAERASLMVGFGGVKEMMADGVEDPPAVNHMNLSGDGITFAIKQSF